MRIAQLVERLTENPGAGVRVPGAARDFSPRVNFRTALCVQSHTSTSVCKLKIPNIGAIPLLAHTKILHTLTGISIVALAGTVHYPVEAT